MILVIYGAFACASTILGIYLLWYLGEEVPDTFFELAYGKL